MKLLQIQTSKSDSWMVLKTNKGAVILEYALLLVICIAMAMAINEIVKMGGNNPGWVVQKWIAIIQVIAQDI